MKSSQLMTRREMLLTTGVAALGLAAIPGGLIDAALPSPSLIRRLKHPVAIAMWDFSWLQRRHPGGGFERWEQVLDELVERGYNAIRIDAFPHLLALPGRKLAELITFPGDPNCRLWGNDVDITVNPRTALVEFLTACQKRDVYVELSTWLNGATGTPEVMGFEGLVKVWEETIDFLEVQGLMKNILFVDLLNEYPYWNNFNWLKQQAVAAGGQPGVKLDTANIHIQDNRDVGLTAGGRQYYREFSTRLLQHFRARYPQYGFALSISVNWDFFHPETCLDMEAMDVLDAHVWFAHNTLIQPFNMGGARKLTPDQRRQKYSKLKDIWAAKQAELTAWMSESINAFAALGRKTGAVVGNTEGWGCVGWDEVEGLDWDFIKQSAEVAVGLALAADYKFICTSNFTHPHFRTLWQDVEWHQRITARIKAGVAHPI